MSQLFPKSSNKLARLTLLGIFLGVSTIGFLGWYYVRSPLTTRQGIPREQPIPFSHKIHAGDLKMDCRYCHTAVEDSSFAAIPTTETCMKCHSVVKKDSPLIAPLIQSMETGMPIEWIRVHDLPDHVYFDHSIHVAKGISCKTCHGQIDQMETVERRNTLLMQWCLQCHKHPEGNESPRPEVFNMEWTEGKPVRFLNEPRVEMTEDEIKTYNQFLKEFKTVEEQDPMSLNLKVNRAVNCSVCHR